MVNQYNAASFSNVPIKSATTNFGDGWPIPSASGVGGGNAVSIAETGMFPNTNALRVSEFQQDALATPDSQQTVSQFGSDGSGAGASAAVLTGAVDGGTAGNKVIDRVDAPSNLDTDPFLQGSV
jgi:hypothetical protein